MAVTPRTPGGGAPGAAKDDVVLRVRGLSFAYRVGDREVPVLRSLDFDVRHGEFVAIQGPSGSGKSTLFYLLGLMLRPTSGSILLEGEELTRKSADELALVRNRRIGFVFQQFHLLPRANVLDNILLPTRYPAELAAPGAAERAKAVELTRRLGIESQLAHQPNQLSGGQQQRVAIARALMQDIDLILADEPTGNLDSASAAQTLDLLDELNRQGKTIVLITHDSEVARRCGKVLHLRDGAFTGVDAGEAAGPGAPAAAVTTAAAVAAPRAPIALRADYGRLLRSVFPLVIENLLRNKGKSLLTMLGVVIGVAAVLAMFTLGQFTKAKILQTYEALGVNLLKVRGYPNWELKASDAVTTTFHGFDYEHDLNKLPKVFPEIGHISPVIVNWSLNGVAGGKSMDKITMLGVTSEYLKISNRRLAQGRNLTPYHVTQRSPVCVVGHEVADRLFPHSDPLGEMLSVNDGRQVSFPCRIIGVLAPVSVSQDFAPPNLQVWLPFTYAKTVGGSFMMNGIYEAAIQIVPQGDVVQAGKKVKNFFTRKYGKAAQFHVDSDSTLVAQMKRFLNIFAALLGAIACLSLLVGGIGINNMMLVSVTERVKEFGLRKALGATGRSIRLQVLLESVVLCAVAGIVGVLLGFGAYELMIWGATRFVPKLQFEWVFEPLAASLSLLAIFVVGVASGFLPALRAERLQIIEALRAE